MSLNNKRFNSDFHNGIPHWKFQRVSAIINMPLIMWFVYSIVTFSDYSYISIMEWVKSPINCILISLMFASIFYHLETYFIAPNNKLKLLMNKIQLKQLTHFYKLSQSHNHSLHPKIGVLFHYKNDNSKQT